ncbi:4'-phosphopantetheinyl transferase superfamily protein [Candidatus Kirkpatrickella diaphorinae]|uniref:Enterobactin synthase component D n=1 Tax=Candidatus Kirkpatrickella diaphorinae TaxID=2984322 RepID=A0ABY6GJC2_9PROT|nr:4'-phosphopantetheinyl transferase superfamily protein [Candidatus Kirkpatrickella diaphorinae]UYH51619.1 4'-phosphopantetheinyl transferase superfamily protein [Candidatus Kirkpatrickella diaphorinae]
MDDLKRSMLTLQSTGHAVTPLEARGGAEAAAGPLNNAAWQYIVPRPAQCRNLSRLISENRVAARMIALHEVRETSGIIDLLPLSLKQAHPSRRRAFLAGRYCALRALRDSGFDGAASLHRLHNGLVDWPACRIGSISHSRKWAISLVAPENKGGQIGVDVEQIIGMETAKNIASLVASPLEWRSMREIGEFSSGVTLMFSAKEALFKALFPATLQFEDFNAAALTSITPASLVFILTQDWSSRWRRGTRITVRYCFFEDHVLTWCRF